MKTLWILALVILFYGCNNDSEEHLKKNLTDADHISIEKIITQWNVSLDSLDIDLHFSLFTDDAITFPYNRGPFIGKEECEQDLQRILRRERPSKSRISNAEIEVIGNWALVRADFYTTWIPIKFGETWQENSRYVWVLTRQSGQEWKISRFTFYPLS